MKMIQKTSPLTSTSLPTSPNGFAGRSSIKPNIAWGIIAIACIGFLYAIFGIEISVFALLGVLIAWWTFEYPEESFLTLIVLSPLLPLLKATQTLGNATLIKDVIIITLFLRNFAFPLLTQKLPYRRNGLFAPIVALTAWAFFEVLRAGITTLAILRLRDIVLYILLYFGVLYLPHTARRMKIRMGVFLATLVVTMLLGIFQFLHLPDSTVLRFDPARQIWIPRIASTFAHPTVFAEYLITGSMLLVGLILVIMPGLLRPAKLTSEVGIRDPRRLAILNLLLLSTVILIYFTYTRAAWIGFVMGIGAVIVVYFLPSYEGRRGGVERAADDPLPSLKTGRSPSYDGEKTRLLWLKLAVSTLICLAALFSLYRFTPVGTFLKSGFDVSYGSNADRIVFIVNLISQTSNTDAVIGKGLGNTISKTREGGDATAFDIASGESRTIQLSKDQTLVDNQYLKTFIEMGVVGIVITFWLFWRFFLASRKTLGQTDNISQILGIFGIGFLAAFMVQALFVDIWDVYPTNAIFWTLAALASQVKIEK
ncbi:MAG: O-antigen ligase family protein [Patescibacteria group bacterium]